MKRTPLSRKTPLRKQSAKKKAYRASSEGKAAAEYMLAVKSLPCCITGRTGGVDAHHCQSGRFGKAKVSDWCVIPLAKEVHRAEYGLGAYHHSKREWEAAHGPDTDYIEGTQRKVRDLFPGKFDEWIGE